MLLRRHLTVVSLRPRTVLLCWTAQAIIRRLVITCHLAICTMLPARLERLAAEQLPLLLQAFAGLAASQPSRQRNPMLPLRRLPLGGFSLKKKESEDQTIDECILRTVRVKKPENVAELVTLVQQGFHYSYK